MHIPLGRTQTAVQSTWKRKQVVYLVICNDIKEKELLFSNTSSAAAAAAGEAAEPPRHQGCYHHDLDTTSTAAYTYTTARFDAEVLTHISTPPSLSNPGGHTHHLTKEHIFRPQKTQTTQIPQIRESIKQNQNLVPGEAATEYLLPFTVNPHLCFPRVSPRVSKQILGCLPEERHIANATNSKDTCGALRTLNNRPKCAQHQKNEIESL
ncbi:hypothetical protein BZA77DRAFT_290758 [Pyronema omphalodes]|nr:hypothetical protein BZA77DRAFT_290758 [Pyronema omphalodes]